MRSIKLVIFDLDGTLVDSFAELVAATNHVRTTFGLRRFTEGEIRKMLGAGGPRLVEKALPDASPEELEMASALYLDYSDANLLTATTCYPGMMETLDALKRNGIMMAITSNKFSTLSRKVLKHFGKALRTCWIARVTFLPAKGPESSPLVAAMVMVMPQN